MVPFRGVGQPKVLQGACGRGRWGRKLRKGPGHHRASSVCLRTPPPYFMALETKGRAWKPATAPKTPRGGFPFERLAKFDATKAASHTARLLRPIMPKIDLRYKTRDHVRRSSRHVAAENPPAVKREAER